MYCVGTVHNTGSKYTELNDKLMYPRAYLQQQILIIRSWIMIMKC
jgi:hypothetical protein